MKQCSFHMCAFLIALMSVSSRKFHCSSLISHHSSFCQIGTWGLQCVLVYHGHQIWHHVTSESSPKSKNDQERWMFWINSGHQGSQDSETEDIQERGLARMRLRGFQREGGEFQGGFVAMCLSSELFFDIYCIFYHIPYSVFSQTYTPRIALIN